MKVALFACLLQAVFLVFLSIEAGNMKKLNYYLMQRHNMDKQVFAEAKECIEQGGTYSITEDIGAVYFWSYESEIQTDCIK